MIFGASRVWDAVSDPLAGYLSDRTVTRFGRRWPWMLAAALPLAACFVALWMPPAWLGETGTIIWLAIALFLFFSAITAFRVPHSSLGAELSADYHDRTRVFTAGAVSEALGGLLGIGMIALMLSSGTDERIGLAWIATVVSALAVVLIVAAFATLREPRENLTRGPSHPGSAVSDIWANPHARRLLLAEVFHTTGLACVVTVVPYVAEYVYGNEQLLPLLLVAFVVPTLVTMPVTAPLSRRFGKRRVYASTRAIEALAFGGLFLGPALPLSATLCLIATAGAVHGVGGILGDSLGADVVDFDELHTGERKEGAYFSFWSLGKKLAVGAAIATVGLSLDISGFEPGAPQSPAALWTIRALVSLVPLALLLVAALFAASFGLNAREHAELRRALAR